MDTLFSNITAVTMDGGLIIKDAYVHVSEGKIAYAGPNRPNNFDGLEIYGRGKVLMPALINAHTHIPMTLLRGYADDYDLRTWLNDYIFPAEARLDGRAVHSASLLALAEMIASGTGAICDMYYFCEEILESVKESGIKANIARGLTCFDSDFDFNTFPAAAELREIKDKWHGFDNGRILIDACIHGEYTSFEKVWRSVSEYAAGHSLGMHVHLSETKAEHDECVARHGMTPAAVLARAGVWGTRAVAAHCVWVTPADLEILREHGVSVAHNPVSNLKLASGIAPVTNMLEAGINVALGTDGVSSNNSHDMFEEVKMAALLQKTRALDPAAVKAYDALGMATVSGAKALGREGQCGVIRAGLDADLIMLDFDRPQLIPCHNIISNLAYAARGGDVVLNMARGGIIYRDGEYKTIDIEKVKYEIRSYALPKILGR